MSYGYKQMQYKKNRKKIILVTGFEPFGGQTVNASWEAVKRLPEEIGGFQVIKCQLPVVFGKAAAKALEEIRRTEAVLVFLTGEAGGREWVTPELLARNARVDLADNEGYIPQEGEVIVEGGPDVIRTGMHVEKIVGKMQDFPISVSENAGRYVCNDLFYLTLHAMQNTDVPVDFVHVPYTEGQNLRRIHRADGQEETEETDVPFLPSDETAAVLERYIELAAADCTATGSDHVAALIRE